MSNNTTIRARFSAIASNIHRYTVEGLANIKAAQNFASQNALCLDEYEEQPATDFKITPAEKALG